MPEAEADIALESYLQSYSEKLLPVYEVEEAMSVLRGRIDADLFEKIIRINTDYKTYVTSNRTPLGSTIGLRGGSTSSDSTYPSAAILSELHANAQALPFDKRTVFSNQTGTFISFYLSSSCSALVVVAYVNAWYFTACSL